MKRIVFGDDPEKTMARLGYREVGRKACFAGMLFKNAPDEYKAGTSILSYFLKQQFLNWDFTREKLQKYINLLLLYFWLDMGWKLTQLRNIGPVLDYWCNESEYQGTALSCISVKETKKNSRVSNIKDFMILCQIENCRSCIL